MSGIAELIIAIERTRDFVVLAESYGLSVFKNSLERVFQFFDYDMGLSSKGKGIFEINNSMDLEVQGITNPSLEKKDPLFLDTIVGQLDIKRRLEEFWTEVFDAMGKDSYEPRPIMGQWPKKVVHSPWGHKSNCTSVEFQPFGESSCCCYMSQHVL